MSKKHNDCLNFECFDVLKGYCLLTDQLVPFEGEACPNFEEKPKCKNCASFANPDKDGIGVCNGKEDKGYWALADRIATNCTGYEKE